MNPPIPPLPQSSDDRLLTKKNAAAMLSISTRTLDRMTAAGKISKVYVGALPRFRESQIKLIVSEGL